MNIDIKIKKEYIDCGDLVYSRLLNENGFVGYINNNYYFLDKNNFENLSNAYKSLDELISKVELELVAKNKELNVGIKRY